MYRLKDGYAFFWDNGWETDLYTDANDGYEEFLYVETIDGTKCAVFKDKYGRLIAQTTTYCRVN